MLHVLHVIPYHSTMCIQLLVNKSLVACDMDGDMCAACPVHAHPMDARSRFHILPLGSTFLGAWMITGMGR